MKTKSIVILACLIILAVAFVALSHAQKRFVGVAGSPNVEGSRTVADGGIKIAGWDGKVDAAETKAGMTIHDARFAQEGDSLHVTTGPAVSHWKSDAMASGRLHR